MNWDLVLSVLLDGIFAAIAAIGFAVISNPPRKAILISALLAAVGHALRFYLLNHTTLGLIPPRYVPRSRSVCSVFILPG